MRQPMVQPELRAKLNRARNAQRELDALRERVEYWRAEAERCTASYGPDTPGGGASDRRAELVARIVDAQREIDARIGEIAAAEREALALIERLDDERARTLLLLRYVDNLTWRQVAERMHYCREHVEKMHRQALESLAAKEGGGKAAKGEGAAD